MERIVVGTDGSGNAEAALRWTAREATLRDAQVEIVYAWTAPYVTVGATMMPAPIPDDIVEEMRKHAQAVLDRAADTIAHSGVKRDHIRTSLVQSGAADALLSAAAGADLLVVGTRGLGGFAGLVLGSVSHQCLHHAPCPVVAVPPAPANPTAS